MDSPVVASVLVGSVGRGRTIDHLLDALKRQSENVPFEVIVADRRQDGTVERIGRNHPEVLVLRAGARTTLPELRAMALEHASGRYIFVTEDHTVPPPDWIERFVEELERAPERVAAVGGPVDNAAREGAVDWAAFFCEYSGHVPPQPGGEVDDLPGMNVAYRREVLAEADPDALRRGFWESTLHARLIEAGHTFLRLPDVVIQHRKHFPFFYFLAQRFHYSRHFAGVRFEPAAWGRRLLYAVLTLGLPVLILSRVGRRLAGHPAYRSHLGRSLPALTCFAIAWAVGETAGYLLGPGDSLAAIE